MNKSARTPGMRSTSRFESKRTWLILGVVALVVLFVPTQLGEFWLLVVTEIWIMSLFALSFNLLFGYTGRLSFGQAAYLGMAGYSMILLYQYAHVDFFLCMIFGVFMGVLWAAFAGYLCNRLSGIYFAIMTIVIAEATFYIFFEWYGFTNGPKGIHLIPPAFLKNTLYFYLFTLAVVIPAIVAFRFVTVSPFGRTLKCIRDNVDKTPYIGVPVRKHTLIAFVIAGFYASLAGVLWATFNSGISPYYCGMMKSTEPVFMAILGGAYTFAGPILGAAIWTFLEVYVSKTTEYWPLAIGAIMILIVLFMPGGILGTLPEKLDRTKWRWWLSLKTTIAFESYDVPPSPQGRLAQTYSEWPAPAITNTAAEGPLREVDK